MRLERLMEEKEITEAIHQVKKMEDGTTVAAARHFVVRQSKSKKWIIGFTYRNTEGYELRTRRGEVREFLRLNGAQKWMEKVGVSEFTVILLLGLNI